MNVHAGDRVCLHACIHITQAVTGVPPCASPRRHHRCISGKVIYMYVCMYFYVYIYVCMYVCMYGHSCPSLCSPQAASSLYIWEGDIHVCMYVCMYVCMWPCASLRRHHCCISGKVIYICMYVCMSLCLYVYVYMSLDL